MVVADVLDPNTGDFNGVSITVDRDQDLDVALFVLAHLFGHTVQWNTSAELRELGIRASSLDQRLSDEQLLRVRAYEREASEYALSLFHQAGIFDLDSWLSDWCAADWAYLETAYRKGQRPPDFRSFFHTGAERLRPRPIPPFHPTRWVSRYSF